MGVMLVMVRVIASYADKGILSNYVKEWVEDGGGASTVDKAAVE